VPEFASKKQETARIGVGVKGGKGPKGKKRGGGWDGEEKKLPRMGGVAKKGR